MIHMIDTTMCNTIVGPVLARAGGYVFDTWTPETGLVASYVYPRADNAYYARAVEIEHYRNRRGDGATVCDTIDEFALEAAWQAEFA
jgi:hypothetical protein